MEESVYQGGELMKGILAASVVIGGMLLLLGRTDAGMLRMYLAGMLEAAC